MIGGFIPKIDSACNWAHTHVHTCTHICMIYGSMRVYAWCSACKNISQEKYNTYNWYRCAVEAFRVLLKTTECEELLKVMDENNFDKMVESEDSLPHGMLFIAR